MNYGAMFKSDDGRLLLTDGAYTYFENAIPPEVTVVAIARDHPWTTEGDWPRWTANYYLMVAQVSYAVRIYLPDGYPIESGALPLVFFRDIYNYSGRYMYGDPANINWLDGTTSKIQYNAVARFSVAPLFNSGIQQLDDGRYVVDFVFAVQVNPKVASGTSSNDEVLDFARNQLQDTLAFTSFIPISNYAVDYHEPVGLEVWNKDFRTTFSTRIRKGYSTGVPMKIGKKVSLSHNSTIAHEATMIPESKVASDTLPAEFKSPWVCCTSNSLMSRKGGVHQYYYKRDDRIIEVVKTYKYAQSWGIFFGGVVPALDGSYRVRTSAVSLDVGMMTRKVTKRSGILQDIAAVIKPIAYVMENWIILGPIIEGTFKFFSPSLYDLLPDAGGTITVSSAPTIEYAREDSVLLLSGSCAPQYFATAKSGYSRSKTDPMIYDTFALDSAEWDAIEATREPAPTVDEIYDGDDLTYVPGEELSTFDESWDAAVVGDGTSAVQIKPALPPTDTTTTTGSGMA
jgi:hypothetical protein